MKVAVTGATGFLGRHVVPALLQRGFEVVAAGRHPEDAYSAGARLSLAKIDMAYPEQAYSALGTPDALLHLAWGGLPNYNDGAHLRGELPKQISFLHAALQSGLKHVVVTGTCLEYGLREGEMDEEMQPAPTTAYGSAKNYLHEYLRDELVPYGLNLTWLRLFYLYGPGQARTSLYSQLKAAVDSHAATFAMSRGDQIRDFLSVEVAAAHISSIMCRNSAYGTVNVCSGTGVDVETLARRWLREWNSPLRLDLGAFQYPEYEPHSFWGSAAKLNGILGTT